MQLSLSLGNQFVWALVDPTAKEFIKITRDEPGFQEVNLILTQKNPGPVKIHLDQFPSWAQLQIKSAVRSGQLINTGDKIDAAKEQLAMDKSLKVETKSTAKNSKK